MPADSLLSARVTKDVQEAYSLVQDYYEINQSDLVRMAPLLLVLLAERNFTERRKEIAAAEQSLRGNPSASEALNIYRESHLKLRGSHFIEYLRDLTESLDDIGQDAVSRDDIDLERDGLPRYRLFHKTREQQDEIMDQAVLERVAADAARDLVKDARSIPQDDGSHIPPEYDGPLLAMARTRLGKFLTEDQKIKLRRLFKDAVHAAKPDKTPPSVQECLEQTAQLMASKMPPLASLDSGYIPPEYDGPLLAIARTRLGRHLTSEQKAEVRRLLRERIAERGGSMFSPSPV